MNIAVTGANGFIGSRFIELFGDKLNIAKLNSKSAPLDDYDKLIQETKNVEVLVHTAFDHSYKKNIVGIKNILQVCKENNINKLIYFSSVSVYDPDIKGILNEQSCYSSLNDPYSKEKRKIESIIDNFKDKKFDILILQPSIVYGLGGNWTKYALHICKSKSMYLPNNGSDMCNIVYIDDVVNAIYYGIKGNMKYEKILISNETITWREFYEKQCNVLKKFNLSTCCNIENDISENEFHSNFLINFIFILWFKTPLGNIFNMMIGVLKRIRAKSYKKTNNSKELKIFLSSEAEGNSMISLGITKKAHSAKFKVDILKAKNELCFEPKFSFNSALRKIDDKIKEVLK